MMLLFNYYPRNTTLEFPEPDIFQGRIYDYLRMLLRPLCAHLL